MLMKLRYLKHLKTETKYNKSGYTDLLYIRFFIFLAKIRQRQIKACLGHLSERRTLKFDF